MQSIFLRIYSGMLLSALVLGVGMFVIATFFNHYRMQSYVESLSEGIFTLVERNLAAKPLPEQQQWLSDMSQMSGLSIKMEPLEDFPAQVQRQLQHQHLLVKASIDQRIAHVSYLRGDGKHVLSLHLRDISEQLMRGLAFLVLNELQRHNRDYRHQPQLLVAALQSELGLDIALKASGQLPLDVVQQGLLDMGEAVAKHDETDIQAPLLILYLPVPGSDKILVLGPVTEFVWVPRVFLLAAVMVGVLLFTVTVFMLLRRLQKRLQRMGDEIKNLEVLIDKESPMTVEGEDMLSALAINVNYMVSRIRSLVKAQSELTQAVSHELRSPIARIKFHLALLEEKLDIRDKKHLAGIGSDVYVLEQLVDEILTLASLERDQPEMNFSQMDIIKAMQELLDGLHGIRPDIKLELKNPENIGVIYADEHYLMRACQNLVINGQRHAHSRVVVSVHIEKKHYSIRVQDDGEGIGDKEKVRVFEPFTRLDGSRNRNSGGYGLGLAIVFQIMRWHGGHVQLLDSSLGGCEFRLNWLKLANP